MFPLINYFANVPAFEAGTMVRNVQNVPYTHYILDDLIQRTNRSSATSELMISNTRQSTGLIQARDADDMNGQIVRRNKKDIVRVTVSGYPQTASITAKEIKGRLDPVTQSLVGFQSVVDEYWAAMARREAAVHEFNWQGALEGKVLSVDENNDVYLLEDMSILGGGPTLIDLDWTDDTLDLGDAIAEAKVEAQMKMGGDAPVVEKWALICVGAAASGIRTNKSLKRDKQFADVTYAGSDKIIRHPIIAENVAVITYSGYLIGGHTALDLDYRTVAGNPVAYGSMYLVPLAPELFDKVSVPPELFETLNQPGLPRYSWIEENMLKPKQEVKLQYWFGDICYCVKQGAIVKFRRPVGVNDPRIA